MDTTGNIVEPSTPEQAGKIGKSSVSTNIHAHKDEHIEASPLDDNVEIEKPYPEDYKKEIANGHYDTNTTTHGRGSEFRVIDDKYQYELEIYPITIYF